MSQYVNLEMSYSTYLQLCFAVEKATTHTEGFDEIQELVHLVDFLEDEYERDCGKQIWIIKPGNCMKNCLETRKYITRNIFIE